MISEISWAKVTAPFFPKCNILLLSTVQIPNSLHPKAMSEYTE